MNAPARTAHAPVLEPTPADYDFAARIAVIAAARSPRAARWLPEEDAAQVGRVACWLAAAAYDPARARGRWRAYLTAKVRQAVVDLLRLTGPVTRSGYVRDGSVLEAECLRVVDDRGEDVPVEAWRGRRDPDLARVETRDALDGATRGLDDRALWVLERVWLDGWTLREVGAELGVSEARACQIHRRALDRLSIPVRLRPRRRRPAPERA